MASPEQAALERSYFFSLEEDLLDDFFSDEDFSPDELSLFGELSELFADLSPPDSLFELPESFESALAAFL